MEDIFNGINLINGKLPTFGIRGDGETVEDAITDGILTAMHAIVNKDKITDLAIRVLDDYIMIDFVGDSELNSTPYEATRCKSNDGAMIRGIGYTPLEAIEHAFKQLIPMYHNSTTVLTGVQIEVRDHYIRLWHDWFDPTLVDNGLLDLDELIILDGTEDEESLFD